MFDLRKYNARAWNEAVMRKSEWTIPVEPDVIQRARAGEWEVALTPTKNVPREWFPPLVGIDLLCLAGGGGQQAPVLAAAGAHVTSFDNSSRQLQRDQQVAQREGLTIHTVEGDMRDLSDFADASFDLIFHPCSNMFVPNIQPVWQECHRVLRPGGVLLAGFCNPIRYLFDFEALEEGRFEVKYHIPYSDLTSLNADERQQLIDDQQPLEFGHTLEEQIGGQIKAGFVITGFYEDIWEGQALDQRIATFIVTRAQKSSN
ncbi:MAG: class I SAM-dependent methyltransferase [Caldilineaceae bacterium]